MWTWLSKIGEPQNGLETTTQTCGFSGGLILTHTNVEKRQGSNFVLGGERVERMALVLAASLGACLWPLR